MTVSRNSPSGHELGTMERKERGYSERDDSQAVGKECIELMPQGCPRLSPVYRREECDKPPSSAFDAHEVGLGQRCFLLQRTCAHTALARLTSSVDFL